MAGFTAIDLSKLPSPDVIEALDFETILADMKARLIGLDPDLEPALELESEPLTRLLQVCAYRELILRQRVNDASRAVMLAFARGSDLDHIAAMFGVTRLLAHPGDPDALPPVPAVHEDEDDDRLRYRVQLSLEGHSTAGPRGSYVFWGLSASTEVKDIDVQSPEPGVVTVTVLSTLGNGHPSVELLGEVVATLNHDDVRPLTDDVRVEPADVLEYTVQAVLTLYPGLADGPDQEIIRQAAEKAVTRHVAGLHRLGHDVTRSGLFAALHQPGVQEVTLARPVGRIDRLPHQVAYCTDIQITIGGLDE